MRPGNGILITLPSVWTTDGSALCDGCGDLNGSLPVTAELTVSGRRAAPFVPRYGLLRTPIALSAQDSVDIPAQRHHVDALHDLSVGFADAHPARPLWRKALNRVPSTKIPNGTGRWLGRRSRSSASRRAAKAKVGDTRNSGHT